MAIIKKQDEGMDWVSEHYYNVLDEFMPTIDGAYEGFQLGYRRYFTFFNSELDYSFEFGRFHFSDENLEVTVRQPESESLYNQLFILHYANPKHSIERIKKQLKIKSIYIDEKSCPAIRNQYEDFHKITLPIVKAIEPDIYCGYKWSYNFAADIYIGESTGHMKLGIQDEEHSFVKWAKKTEEVLEECIRVGINNGTMEWEARPNN